MGSADTQAGLPRTEQNLQHKGRGGSLGQDDRIRDGAGLVAESRRGGIHHAVRSPGTLPQAEIVPHKKGKVQEDSIIKMLLTLPLALCPLASIRGADIASLRDAWLQGAVFAMRPDGVARAFERAVQRARGRYEVECEEAGTRPRDGFLVDLRFHDLRHEATSRLAEVFPMHELTKITGHRDPRMLMRYYHPKAEKLAKKMI